jgi:histidyl-tRNA synthetase
MSDPLSTEPYKGVRDFYPRDWAKLNALFDTVRETLETWGYEEYNASPLERSELYEAKTSEDIVNEETYTFTDRGDRRVTLRPEMTPSLARMVAAKRRELAFPLRWFSIGNRFRYERPQRGRLREFYQVDVDLIGLPEGAADLEVVQLAASLLKGFGAQESDFVIRMNSRALLNAACEAAGLTAESTRTYLRLLDKKAKLDAEAFRSASRDITEQDPLALIENSATETIALERKKLEERIEALKASGVGNVVLDASITRGFDYYTGMVFEVYDASPENTRAMFGGGRYDRLLSLFGGEPIPAVGFALGDVTLENFLETHGINGGGTTFAADLYLGTPTKDDISNAQAFAEELRKGGVRVFVNLTEKTLGEQVKDALKRAIPYFFAYGVDEANNQKGRLKKLATNEEAEVSLSDIPSRLY